LTKLYTRFHHAWVKWPFTIWPWTDHQDIYLSLNINRIVFRFVWKQIKCFWLHSFRYPNLLGLHFLPTLLNCLSLGVVGLFEFLTACALSVFGLGCRQRTNGWSALVLDSRPIKRRSSDCAKGYNCNFLKRGRVVVNIPFEASVKVQIWKTKELSYQVSICCCLDGRVLLGDHSNAVVVIMSWCGTCLFLNTCCLW